MAESPSPSLAPAVLAGAAVAETHISVLIFLGDRAYKLKKPVHFPFADLTTREERERICHREVELNRRLAPDVYLGVLDLVGPDGRPCDHLVVMRRMPDDRRLGRLVQDADPAVPAVIDELAAQIAAFHATADRSATIDRAGTRDTAAAEWAENFDELRPFAGTVLDPDTLARAEHLATRFLAGREPLFAARVASGAVCDGHGDLQADDIFCLDDGPRILDCIEFCDDLRYGDVAADVAFLAMDLDRLGAPDLADRFVAAYETAAAPIPRPLLDLSIAYRAQVRCKVSCLRAAQQEPGSPAWDASAAAARQLLDLCVEHLEACRVRLVVVGGLPGTGKSTVAAAVADALGATLLRSDVLRKELAGLAPAVSAAAPLGAGLYGAEQKADVYRALVARAADELALGRSVVLDASFGDLDARVAARDVATATASDLVELRCVLDPDLADERIRARAAAGGDASDATPSIARALAATFAPWPEATDVPTDAAPAAVAARALATITTGPRGTP